MNHAQFMKKGKALNSIMWLLMCSAMHGDRGTHPSTHDIDLAVTCVDPDNSPPPVAARKVRERGVTGDMDASRITTRRLLWGSFADMDVSHASTCRVLRITMTVGRTTDMRGKWMDGTAFWNITIGPRAIMWLS